MFRFNESRSAPYLVCSCPQNAGIPQKIRPEGRADSHGPRALRLCSLSQRKARDCAPQRLIKVGKIVYAIPCFKFCLHAQIRKRL